ncbi:MAG: hypothetical protein D3914_09070, partial [Candidatus Electrothrix sp. LOE2]|nr:hypothetical protein [Candidatus Electrothrix sp. LOE2]
LSTARENVPDHGNRSDDSITAARRFPAADFENLAWPFGADIIPPGIKPVGIHEEQEKLLTFILDNYVDYSAFTLSAMTHNEAPWLDAKENTVISDAAIFSYYSNQPFANNFLKLQNGAQQPFHVLKSNSWHSFTLDMDKEEAETFATYPNAEDYQYQNRKAKQDFQNLLREIDELL